MLSFWKVHDAVNARVASAPHVQTTPGRKVRARKAEHVAHLLKHDDRFLGMRRWSAWHLMLKLGRRPTWNGHALRLSVVLLLIAKLDMVIAEGMTERSCDADLAALRKSNLR